jgi:excisionase family DNA binding protein
MVQSPCEILLTVAEVAVMLRLRPGTIHRLVREKRLACVQATPRTRLFRPEHIDAFLQAQTREVPKPIDKNSRCRLPLPSPLRKKGGLKSSEGAARALREEMRSW